MIFDPHTSPASAIAHLGGTMIAIAIAVCVLVALYIGAGLWLSRRRTLAVSGSPGVVPPLLARHGWTNWVVIGVGLVLPATVLLVILGYTMSTLRAVSAAGSASQAGQASQAPLAIDVIGHQWWWEVRYPDEQVVTANEIHVPTGRTIALKLTSDDVIHSFWAPQLMGKADLIPGTTTSLQFQVDQAGEYRGQCAEFCGIQHAHMAFYVIAEAPATFDSWLSTQRQPSPQPTDSLVLQGQQVFLGASCVYCHTVQGTNASGTLGPDLTHLASRKTIGAGMLPNTPGALGGWIENPQAIKPGNKMPPMQLDGPDLQALLAYLGSLK